MKKYLFPIIFLLAIPFASAECSLANLGACLPEAIFSFFLSILNAPLGFLLNLINDLITEPVTLDSFHYFWVIIVYIVSIFYSLMFVYAGYNFLISGHDVARRERAKLFLRDTLIMVVAVNASFYLYGVLLEISALLSAGVMGMINPEFFLLTADNFVNIGLEFIFVGMYVITLATSLILFALRYIFVAAGLVFFPIGIFMYFLSPLKAYGKLVINTLLVVIFVPFFSSLVLLMSSMLLDMEVFSNVKILVMISAFNLVNLGLIFLIIFAIVKSAFGLVNSDVGRGVKMVVGKI